MKLTKSIDRVILVSSTLEEAELQLVSVNIWIEMMLRQSIMTRETNSFCF